LTDRSTTFVQRPINSKRTLNAHHFSYMHSLFGHICVLCRPRASLQRSRTCIRAVRGEMLLDAQYLIPLRQSFRASKRTYLELTTAPAHSKVGDGCVFGLPGAGGDNSPPGGVFRSTYRCSGLSDRSRLIYLDQCSVHGTIPCCLSDTRFIGYEIVISDDLHLRAEFPREPDECAPIVLSEGILDGRDRIAADPGADFRWAGADGNDLTLPIEERTQVITCVDKVWEKPRMSAALAKRAQKLGSPFHQTSACSAATGSTA
jgi:hypothetical protein